MSNYFLVNGPIESGFITHQDQTTDGLSFIFISDNILKVSGDIEKINAWANRVRVVTEASPTVFASSVCATMFSKVICLIFSEKRALCVSIL